MQRKLKSFDFYQSVSIDVSQGTTLGGWISLAFGLLLAYALISTIIQHFDARVRSDLFVDQKQMNQLLKVSIDISFEKYPCSILSMNAQNVLRSNYRNNKDWKKLDRYQLPENKIFTESNYQGQQRYKSKILQDLINQKGCRMTGSFYIDRVPGNIYFSCQEYQRILYSIGQQLRNAPQFIDMSHTINYLYFDDYNKSSSMKDFKSKKQIKQQGLGISYIYFLSILRNQQINNQGKETIRNQYTVRSNQAISDETPIVLFKYETTPISYLSMHEYDQFHRLFVRIVGLVGGIFTLAIVVNRLVDSSVNLLIQKQLLNKLI